MTDDFELNERAKAWIAGLESLFEAVEAADTGTRPSPSTLKAHPAPGAFKIL